VDPPEHEADVGTPLPKRRRVAGTLLGSPPPTPRTARRIATVVNEWAGVAFTWPTEIAQSFPPWDATWDGLPFCAACPKSPLWGSGALPNQLATWWGTLRWPIDPWRCSSPGITWAELALDFEAVTPCMIPCKPPKARSWIHDPGHPLVVHSPPSLADKARTLSRLVKGMLGILTRLDADDFLPAPQSPSVHTLARWGGRPMPGFAASPVLAAGFRGPQRLSRFLHAPGNTVQHRVWVAARGKHLPRTILLPSRSLQP
jgi:hypothetical protein